VKITKTEEQWKKQLTPEQYRVLRESGTERAFTGKYWDNHAAGIYKCAACGLDLFDSKTKFESGTGWPSFWTVIPGHVEEHRDTSLGMLRVEVLCARCGGHLGHVFDDGPEPTGLRYCINSVSLAFDAKK
jgi:peptide-methionine (R)-S-oxide reductase